jgi:hypothetical protein
MSIPQMAVLVVPAADGVPPPAPLLVKLTAAEMVVPPEAVVTSAPRAPGPTPNFGGDDNIRGQTGWWPPVHRPWAATVPMWPSPWHLIVGRQLFLASLFVGPFFGFALPAPLFWVSHEHLGCMDYCLYLAAPVPWMLLLAPASVYISSAWIHLQSPPQLEDALLWKGGVVLW